MVDPKILSEERKIGGETVTLEKEDRELLENLWKEIEEVKKEVIDTKNIFHHLDNLEEGFKRAKAVHQAHPLKSGQYLSSLRGEVQIAKKFLFKLKTEHENLTKQEVRISKIIHVMSKHLKNLEKDIDFLYKEAIRG